MSDERPNDSLDDYLRIARLRAVTRDGRTRISFGAPVLVLTALWLIGASAALGALVYFILLKSHAVTMGRMGMVIAPCAVVSIILIGRVWRQNARGERDLVVDRRDRAVYLPRGYGRDGTTAIPFEAIADIAPAEALPANDDMLDADAFGRRRYQRRRIVPDEEVRRTGHRDEMGQAVIIEWSDGERTIVSPVVTWTERRRANAFAAWLKETTSGGGD